MNHLKQLLPWLVGILFIFAIYVWTVGLWPQYFDIAWDEEVQLHDGRVIVVHVKNTYERRTKNLSRYEGAIFRKNEFTWYADEKKGHLKFMSRLPVSYLGKFGEDWFVVLAGQGPWGNFPEEMPHFWGRDFTTLEQRLAIFSEGIFQPMSWDKAPSQLTRMNLTPSMPVSELSKFDGKKMTIEEKKHLDKIYATPYAHEITRPLRMNPIKGNKND